MGPFRRACRIGLFVCAAFAVSLPARADIIYLRNGKKLRGKVVDEYAGKLEFETTFGRGRVKYSIPIDDVLRINRDPELEKREADEPEPAVAAKATKGFAGVVSPAEYEKLDIEKWAVIVGISDYEHSPTVPDLKYADDDAKAMYEFLISEQGGSFRPSHVKILVNAKAKAADVRYALGPFLSKAHPDDIVYIHFSGHGMPDPLSSKVFYLLTHESHPERLLSTAIPMDEVRRIISDYVHSRRVVLVVDACHSGGVRGRRSLSKNLVNKYLKELGATRPGIAVLTASREGEESQEYEAGQKGLFTHFLLDALQGAGDADGNGLVTLEEAYQHLNKRVVRESHNQQHPVASGDLDYRLPMGIVVKSAAAEAADVSKAEATPTTAEAGAIRPGTGPPKPAKRPEQAKPSGEWKPPKYKLWKRLCRTMRIPGPDGKVQQVPAGVICDVKCSPDGRCIGVAHSFGVDLRDGRTYSLIRRIGGETSLPGCVDFTHDGRSLSIGYEDGTLEIWRVSTGQRLVKVNERARKRVCGISFSPDDRWLACGTATPSILIWDARSGRRLLRLKGHRETIMSVAFSPDGTLLASGSQDGSVRVWDAISGQERSVFKGHKCRLCRLLFSPRGRRIATCSERDKEIRIWDALTGEHLMSLVNPCRVNIRSIAYSPDGTRLASGSGHGVRIWDMASGRSLKFRSSTHAVYYLAFRPDSRAVIAGTRAGSILALDADSLGELFRFEPYGGRASSVDLASEAGSVVAGYSDGAVRIWDTASGELRQVLRAAAVDDIYDVSLDSGGAALACRGRKTGIVAWDAVSGEQLSSAPSFTLAAQVDISADETLLAFVNGGTVGLLKWPSLDPVRRVRTQHGGSVCIGPRGQRMASGHGDGVVRIWNMATGENVRVLHGHTGWVYDLAFSPDGRFLASCSRWALLWDLNATQPGSSRVPTANVHSVTFTSDGRGLLCGYSNGIRLFEVRTWREVDYLPMRRAMRVPSMALSRDGGVLAAAAHDGMIHLWRRQDAPEP